MSRGSYRVRPPVTITCNGCPRTVADIHPNPSPETAELVAHVSHKWNRLDGVLYCPECLEARR